MAFVDDLSGVFLVLRLSREGESVFGLAVGDLVDPVFTSKGQIIHTSARRRLT